MVKPLIALLVILAGCTVRQASPVSQRPDRLCIERNPAVVMEDFSPTLQDVLRERGVQSASYNGEIPPTACAYILTYSARRGWDMVSYLKLVELTVTQRDGTMVGPSLWRHRGGFGLNKWAHSRGKIASAVDGLLARPS